VDRATVETYERSASRYAELRPPRWRDAARAFAATCLPGRVVADLGCGPGIYVDDLPRPLVALDAAAAMLDLVGARPGVVRVQADLEALPFRDRSLGGAWARNTYLHVPKARLPLELARLHWAMDVGAPLTLSVVGGDSEGPWPDDDIGPRFFARWRDDELRDVLVGAGFDDIDLSPMGSTADVWARARRAVALPDTVGPEMRLLMCGLNPSVYSAERGIAYARPGNRFWPAMLAAGLVSRDRDPLHALVRHGVGSTNVATRPTVAASELSVEEYRTGLERVRRLCVWLRPGCIVFVGLGGWRAVVDRRAAAGPVDGGFGGVPPDVMPSTSGLNASSQVPDLVAHLRRALDLSTWHAS
jgi:TDG/mug DNA glycosylase family protein